MTQQRILQRQMGRSFSFGDVRTIALIAGLFALLGVLYLVQSTQATYAGRHIRDYKQEIERLQRLNEQLEIDIAASINPDRIAKAALSLGLHPPKEAQIRYKLNLKYPLVLQPAKKSVNPPAPESNWFVDWLRGLWETGARTAEATSR